MGFEIVRWASIAFMLVATAGNIFSMFLNIRCSRKLDEIRLKYIEAYMELLKEKENELYDKDCK